MATRYKIITEANRGSTINSLTEKTTPVDADMTGLMDSAASNILKKLSWANIKATLKTYFDTLYPAKDGWQAVSDSWSYASADAPTFTITVPAGAASLYSVGMRIKLTQTTVKYFIITAVADTVLTVYGGTDYTLVDSAISAISFSTQKAPLGFPLNPTKWTVEVTNTTDESQANPTQNVWYNLGSIAISIPVGCWRVGYQVCIQVNETTDTEFFVVYATLSTANNSDSDTDFKVRHTANRSGYGGSTVNREKYLNLSTKTTYYLNAMTDSPANERINFVGAYSKTIIRATCAYL